MIRLRTGKVHASLNTEASVVASIVADPARSLVLLGLLKCPLPPRLDVSTQFLVLNIVKRKLRFSEPTVDRPNRSSISANAVCLANAVGSNPRVFLACEFEQPVKTESIFKSLQV